MTQDPQGCPPGDLLIEAAESGSDQAVRERVADHLIACAACADEFRLLQALAPWATAHAHLVAPPGDVAVAPAARRGTAIVWAYATAAAFALAAVGLTFAVARLTRENRTLEARVSAPQPVRPGVSEGAPPISRDQEARLTDQQRTIAALEQRLRATETPDLNAPIVDLEASDATRSAGRPERSTIPSGARSVVFVLNTAHVRPGAVFEVDIVDAGGNVIWTGSGLKQSADGTLTLTVPRAMVAQSSRVRLYSRAASRRTLVEEYVLPSQR